MPDALCIIGTDTDAGKTFVTAALARAATETNKTVLVIKPVQTGCVTNEDGTYSAPDVAVYLKAAPKASACAIEFFEPACSPHLAAKSAGRYLSAQILAEAILEKIAFHKADYVFIEGAGGLFTPLNETETLLDLFLLLSFPLMLVVGNKLGVVNHALLTIEACTVRNLSLIGFTTTEPFPAINVEEKLLRADNISIITTLSGLPCLADIKHLPGLREKDNHDRAWEQVAEAVRPVLNSLNARSSNAPKAFSQHESLLSFDRDHIWHPYTSAIEPLPVWEAVKTHDTHILLRDGRELVDGMASWWCAIHGYNNPALLKALYSQAARMPHVMFGGLTHKPAVELAEKLLRMVPENLAHIFFADSGSVAVEVALKMALQYQLATGATEKKRFMTVRGSYHGDTFGAMSLCDPENGMHHLFTGTLPSHIFAPRPECRFDRPYDPASFTAFNATLKANAESVAAVVLEPVVQGAGGMWFYHPDFLRDVKNACNRNGCLLILDEIATGFGRTGKMFACEHAGIEPDILCVGKGLTGGIMSLAATLATKEVAEGISRNGGVLMHGPTFMGNPLACAIAGESLSLLSGNEWKSNVLRIEEKLKEGLLPCFGMPGVKDARVLGTIGVLEMNNYVNVTKLQQYFVQEGVWIRPFAKLIYIIPPYPTTNRDLETLTRAMRDAVEKRVWQ